MNLADFYNFLNVFLLNKNGVEPRLRSNSVLSKVFKLIILFLLILHQTKE